MSKVDTVEYDIVKNDMGRNQNEVRSNEYRMSKSHNSSTWLRRVTILGHGKEESYNSWTWSRRVTTLQHGYDIVEESQLYDMVTTWSATWCYGNPLKGHVFFHK